MLDNFSEVIDWQYRADTASVGDWHLTSEGYLVANAKIARTGIQEYKNSDGTIRKEFRPPEEVANKDSLNTLRSLPVTVEHPSTLLNDSNAKQYMVGWTGETVTYDSGFVHCNVKILDKAAVQDAVSGGRIELSVGYLTKLDWTAGEWQGDRYDCIQRQIVGNHVALTAKARGGANLRLYPLATVNADADWASPDSEIWSDNPEARFDSDSLFIEVGGREKLKTYSRDDLAEMKPDDVIDLCLELQDSMAEINEEMQETKDSQAYWEGRSTVLTETLDSLDTGSTAGTGAGKTDRRIEEKNFRIQELEGRIDSAESELSGLRRQAEDAKTRCRQLSADLDAERNSRHDAIVGAREDWVKIWNKAVPFLPSAVKKEPDYTLDSINIMRIALQNGKPNLNLDTLIEDAANADDAVKTAFSVMVAEGVNKGAISSPTGSLFTQARSNEDSNYYADGSESLSQLRNTVISNVQEAWKVKN